MSECVLDSSIYLKHADHNWTFIFMIVLQVFYVGNYMRRVRLVSGVESNGAIM